jgi:surfactin synthase thioesterase subunit
MSLKSMSKLKIHFAHANGFPAQTYLKLFSQLENDFEINFIDKHGHNPQFPVTDNWIFLAKELQNEIETRYKSEPIIGIGHSLGGILHYLVACQNPKLYSQIILLDAPIISRFSSFILKNSKRLKLIERFSPSRIARFRRNLWKSHQEMFEHFANKPKFAAFDDDVLRDYVKHGTVKTEKGISLAFEPEIEAEIYRTVPDNLPTLNSKNFLPISYIGGLSSIEARLAGINSMKRMRNFKFEFIEGSHLFPFERPEETTISIQKILKDMS